ncbi:MAG: hypothetical protein AB2533_11710 [Candidatus Thiodiazotropha endolucinida]
MTTLSEQASTFGQYLLQRYGERVHKIALDAAFTCPNRDGSKGSGGCTFCNNVSFSPNGRLGTDGLKLHPLHVVKGTQLANAWRRGEYRPLTLEAYVDIAADLVQQTPSNVVWHRLTGTASETILLAPLWCARKWLVLNAITTELQRRRTTCRQVA